MATRTYQLRRLDDAALAMARRRGKRCARNCDAPPAWMVTSIAPGRRYHGTTRTWLLCQSHAKEFGRTHLIETFVEN